MFYIFAKVVIVDQKTNLIHRFAEDAFASLFSPFSATSRSDNSQVERYIT